MTKLLDLICPVPKGYVPYLSQVRIDLRRAYLKGVILGLTVGFLLGFGTSLYRQDQQRKEMDAFQKEVISKMRVSQAEHTKRRESLGDEISRRTMAEMKARKAGVKP